MKTKIQQKTPLGLYVHIPFCKRKCAYCAFPSRSLPKDHTLVDDYFDALLSEITTYAGFPEKYTIQTVYFGGGTPSCVDPEYIHKTLSHLGDIFHFNPGTPKIETTIEINPGTTTPEILRFYRAIGFNRLSVGLQATQDSLLKTLGRIHTFRDFDELISKNDTHFDNLSIDLMFGLPGQTVSDLMRSVDILLKIPNVRHISAYSLIIEQDTPFETLWQTGKLILPDEESERTMAHALKARLEKEGFHHYEISNFAKPGYESRHNNAYWNLTPYLGFGAGAAGYFKNRRFTHTADINSYIQGVQAGKIPNSDDHFLSEEERKGDYLFLGLRRLAGINALDYADRFQENLFDTWNDTITRLCNQGLLSADLYGIRLTPLGCDLANQVFMAFV